MHDDGTVEPVVVLSHRLWLRLFEGRPEAIGSTLRLNNRPHTVIGVMPPRFGWYGNEGFWLPMSLARKDIPFLAPIVRLRPGVTKEVAQQALHAFNQRLSEESPSTFPARGFTTSLANYLDVTVASGEMRSSLQLLLGAVAFLLLIACANVANLQLARGTRAGAGDGRPDVDWCRPTPPRPPAPHGERRPVARRRRARRAVRLRGDQDDRLR